MEIAVRREFMENLTLDPGGEVRFDAEVLLFDESGQKTLIRNFLFSEGPETSPINHVHIARASCAKKERKANSAGRSAMIRYSPSIRAQRPVRYLNTSSGLLSELLGCPWSEMRISTSNVATGSR